MKKVKQMLEMNERRPAWLCRKAGISHALWTYMDQGKRSVTETTKQKIADVFNLPVSVLFDKN
jgi:hypothetical protein